MPTKLPWRTAKFVKATLISAALLLCLCVGGFIVSRSRTGGQYFYPLDDAYIGMAMAKNLSRHGIWGTSQEFASATSSPGFVLLLSACYALTGPNLYWPLILATIGAITALFAVSRVLRNTPPHLQIWSAVAVALLAPLHVMALIGMEHSMHIAFTLLFLAFAVPVISKQMPLRLPLLATAALMVSFRYEGLFVASGACVLLLLQRRWGAALVIAAAAWAPAAVFGTYFRLHGGGWFPNSLLLKGGPTIGKLISFLVEGLYLLPLMLLVTWAALRCWRPDSPARVALGITTVAIWLHFLLGRFGWVYRYEAYLISLAIVSLTLMASERSFKRAFKVTAVLAYCCLALHALVATMTLPDRSRVMYSQQYQTANLASILGVPVAVNDLGLPAYFSEVPITDLVGLGTQEVMNERRAHPYTTEYIRDLVRRRNVRVVAVYDSWFKDEPRPPWGGPPLPPDFIRVADLHSPDPSRYAADDTVTYYAVPGEESRLRTALQKLRPSMPPCDTLTLY